jgi:hypothetical protein
VLCADRRVPAEDEAARCTSGQHPASMPGQRENASALASPAGEEFLQLGVAELIDWSCCS